ncbi:hypothetical protein COLO4_03852 [Corchorus olitorius]|uniref:Uncharacterized protein n=1 Tax=Corchorus olitorius TaxID=93759 RepID=A0A1R3KWH4_9ROSI|nr:hypothetical protein COLO4_03852 [Corchorus olitorius]
MKPKTSRCWLPSRSSTKSVQSCHASNQLDPSLFPSLGETSHWIELRLGWTNSRVMEEQEEGKEKRAKECINGEGEMASNQSDKSKLAPI